MSCRGAVVQSLLILHVASGFLSAQPMLHKLEGLNFSPYKDGQDHLQIDAAQIRQRMAVVANHTNWIRTYGCLNGLGQSGKIAHSLGIKAAIGVRIGRDLEANNREIACGVRAALAGEADMLIVGNEVLSREDAGEQQLLAYIQFVRQNVPAGVPVTTADVYGALIEHPAVLAASDIVMANFDPYGEGRPVDTAVAAIDTAYEQLAAAANAKPVAVSVTRWPSDGNAVGAAMPSPGNAATYFSNFISWALTKNVRYFYSNVFDEAGSVQSLNPAVSSLFNPLVPGDFDANGTPDIVWQNDNTRQVYVWYMGGPLGSNYIGASYLAFNGMAGWSVAAIADLNGDGHHDLLWQNNFTGQVYVWYLGGPIGNTYLGAAYIPPIGTTDWTLVGAADFNSDGGVDLVWQNNFTGQIYVWYMGGPIGTTYLGATYLTVDGMPGWSIISVADLNNDGHPDLVWQNASTGQIYVWYMGGAIGDTFLGAAFLTTTGMSGWTAVGMADFNSDGHPDLIWQNTTTRQVYVWYMGGPLGNLYLGATFLDPVGQLGWTVKAHL